MGDPGIGTAVVVADADGSELAPVIVVARTEEGLAVIPVSDDVHMGTDWDLFLPRQLLGYDALAMTWNHGVVLAEQVHDHIAQLSRELVTDLHRMMYAAARSGAPPEDVGSGAPVLSAADPRLLFQDEVAESLRAFWEPAMVLAGAATLGEVIRHRRLELGLPENFAKEIPDLEHDRVYLQHAMPAKDLAAVLRRLRIRASARLALLTRMTLEMQAPALPRGAKATGGDSPAEYVADLLRELERGA
jgi:hypothetical protein